MNDRSSSLNCVYTDCFTKVKWINYGHCNVWHKCWSKGQCRIELYYGTKDNVHSVHIMENETHYLTLNLDGFIQ